MRSLWKVFYDKTNTALASLETVLETASVLYRTHEAEWQGLMRRALFAQESALELM
jgi:hypothetical protein